VTGKFIIAQLELENSIYGSIPYVLLSNHPRFLPGTRFDYGFLHIALDEGYSVYFVAREIPERMEIWKDGCLVKSVFKRGT
jgi:hypothetical protein